MAEPLTSGAQIAGEVDRLSATFARELARVLHDAETALRPILRQALAGSRSASALAARGLALRTALRQALTQAGYDALVTRASDAAVTRMAAVVWRSRLVRAGATLVRPDARKLQALAALGQQQLLGVADEVAAALWRSLVQSLFTVRDPEDVIADLLDVFGDEVAHLGTLYDTQVSIFGRQVEALANADAEADQPYLYVGPVDGVTRLWCLARVGKVYSRDVIEAMDNHQLVNPFLTGGGYNCRHSWLAVQSDELRALMNTGEVAPEFVGPLAFARRQREQRLRRAA